MVVGGSYVIIKGDQLGEIQRFVCGWGSWSTWCDAAVLALRSSKLTSLCEMSSHIPILPVRKLRMRPNG